jgi:hypothetical protein
MGVHWIQIMKKKMFKRYIQMIQILTEVWLIFIQGELIFLYLPHMGATHVQILSIYKDVGIFTVLAPRILRLNTVYIIY